MVSISVTFLVFQSSYSLLVINYFSSCWKWNSPELIVLCFNNLLSDSNFGLLLLSEASTRLTSKDPGKSRFICSLLLAFCCSSCFCEWTSKKDKLSECVGIDRSKGRDGDACINSAINSCVTGLCLRMGWDADMRQWGWLVVRTRNFGEVLGAMNQINITTTVTHCNK